MPQGRGRKAQVDVAADAPDSKRGAAIIPAIEARADERVQRSDVVQQLAHLRRGRRGGRALVERGHEFHGQRQALEVGLQLGFQGGVKHRRAPSSGGRATVLDRARFWGPGFG